MRNKIMIPYIILSIVIHFIILILFLPYFYLYKTSNLQINEPISIILESFGEKKLLLNEDNNEIIEKKLLLFQENASLINRKLFDQNNNYINENKNKNTIDTINNILSKKDNIYIDNNINKKIEKFPFNNNKNINIKYNLQKNLNNIIGNCVSKNWDIGLIQGSGAYNLSVTVEFQLNIDGSLSNDPKITPYGGDVKDRDVISIQALSALKKCIPFSLPANRYNEWKNIIINMKAFPDI